MKFAGKARKFEIPSREKLLLSLRIRMYRKRNYNTIVALHAYIGTRFKKASRRNIEPTIYFARHAAFVTSDTAGNMLMGSFKKS